jgi:hypothetical protein
VGFGAKSERREHSTDEARRAAAKNAIVKGTEPPARAQIHLLNLPHRVAGADGFWNCRLDTSVFGSLISILDTVKFNDTVGKSPRGEASHACHFLRR